MKGARFAEPMLPSREQSAITKEGFGVERRVDDAKGMPIF